MGLEWPSFEEMMVMMSMIRTTIITVTASIESGHMSFLPKTIPCMPVISA